MVRKGEIGRAQIQRQWPHRVELPAETLRGTANSEATFSVTKALGAAPYPIPAFRDDRDFAVFHFATAEAAQAFHARFGGTHYHLSSPAGGPRHRRCALGGPHPIHRRERQRPWRAAAESHDRAPQLLDKAPKSK